MSEPTYHAGAAAIDNAMAAIADLQAECARLSGERDVALIERADFEIGLTLAEAEREAALSEASTARDMVVKAELERVSAVRSAFALHAALTLYGRHHARCPYLELGFVGRRPCTCGLSAALKGQS